MLNTDFASYEPLGNLGPAINFAFSIIFQKIFWYDDYYDFYSSFFYKPYVCMVEKLEEATSVIQLLKYGMCVDTFLKECQNCPHLYL